MAYRSKAASSNSRKQSRWLEDLWDDDTAACAGGPDKGPPVEATYIQNVAFALKEKLAGSLYLKGTSVESTIQFSSNVQDAPPALAEAQDQLQRLVMQRLKELMLLTDWPLVKARRTQLQLDRIYQQGDYQHAWEVVGERNSATQDFPKLPPAIKLHVYGPMDVLLVLAKMMPKDMPLSSTQAPAGSSGSTTGSGSSSILSRPLKPEQLPRSLGILVSLPALEELVAPSLDWLRHFFTDLRPQQRHVGIDDRLLPWFKDVKSQAGTALLEEGCIKLCRSFARFGVPPGMRAAVWETALGLGPATDDDYAKFEGLCQLVLEQPLLADICVSDDMPLVGDSEHFFLFEETLRAVMLAFLRDPEVAHFSCVHGPRVRLGAAGQPVQAAAASASGDVSQAAADGQQQHKGVSYPPCDVVPFHGLLLLAAPIAFLYEQPHAVYRMFKAMYCRYWSKLHSFGNVGLPSPSLPLLCKTFETTLQALDPEVFTHMCKLGCLPTSLALPWLMCGFVGHLGVEEVLLVWDRVIGMDSLLPLPMLAVAIICFRRQVLLACQSLQEVHEAMSDISQLQAIPLLQALLFQG